MTFRKIVSLSIAISFVIILVTAYFSFIEYRRSTATIHTVFGIMFTLGIAGHLFNNFKSLKNYLKGSLVLILLSFFTVMLLSSYYEKKPFSALIQYGSKLKANAGSELNQAEYEIYKMDLDKDISLTVDLLRSEHYWHPQMAIWVEDSLGNYLRSIFITKATAEGLFFGGRSKENFKSFDENIDASGEYRRVNALPIWSHQRGVQYEDGMYVPTNDDPLPDAISGATFIDNFKLLSSIEKMEKFVVKLEINVAFDDNEFYSEFDFPDDEIFHNGTGQLGQPSIIFKADVDMTDGNDYYLMELIGHGHQSGQDGIIYQDVSGLTTALEIVERIVLGVELRVKR